MNAKRNEKVENGLLSFGKEQNRYRSLKESAAAHQHSWNLGEQQYRSAVGLLDVLEARNGSGAKEGKAMRKSAAKS